MKRLLSNLLFKFILIEIPFILLVFALYNEDVESIYYFNVNNYYLISVLIWWNFKKSKINKNLILVWGIGASIYAFGSIAGFIFHNYFFDSIYLHYLNSLVILFALIDFYKSTYLFSIVIYPRKDAKFQIKISLFLFFLISVSIYSQLFFKNVDFNRDFVLLEQFL